MRTVMAAIMLAALTSSVCAQMPPINLMGRGKPAPTAEEVKRQQAIDEAYKSATSKIPARKADPWGSVRAAEPKPPGKPAAHN